MFFLINLTCDVKVVHVLVLKLSDLTTCTVQIQLYILLGVVISLREACV